jgi:Tfp pilus assembly protein PilN
MLRLNLSTRPFYNERAVTAGIALVAALTAALTTFNALQIVSLNNRNGEFAAQAAAAESRAAELRSRAEATRKAMVSEQVSEVQAEAREANLLIDRRVFSWTDLFNRFEETLPADVRILAVAPQVDPQGRMLVAVNVVSRTQEARNEFIESLEETGAFSQVISRNDSAQDDGTLRSVIQGYYSPAPRAAAVSSAPASDSNEAGGNASPSNATAAAPPARGSQ